MDSHENAPAQQGWRWEQPAATPSPSEPGRPGEGSVCVSGRPVDVPTTGDEAIDGAIAELAEVTDQPLERHIAAGERALRVLQGRLNDLAGE